MDSNTISFNMIASKDNQQTKSPQMLQIRFGSKQKGGSKDELTNSGDFNQNTESSNSTAQNSLKFQVSKLVGKKTKQIQKLLIPSKLMKPCVKSQNSKKVLTKHPLPHSTPCQPYLIKKQVHNSQQLSFTRQLFFYFTKNQYFQNQENKIIKHDIVKVFDWMNQISYLLKLTKDVFYRAILIFKSTLYIKQELLYNVNVQKYACAAILISAKLDNSNVDYLDEIYIVNKKQISKQILTNTQICIYETLKWQIPLFCPITQQITQTLTKWNKFLQKCSQSNMIRQQSVQKFTLSLSSPDLIKQKLSIQIIYLTDLIILNQHAKYLSDQKFNFQTPITIAIYIVLTIMLGDVNNKEKYLHMLIKYFYRQELNQYYKDIDRLPYQIQYYFQCFHVYSKLNQLTIHNHNYYPQIINYNLQTYFSIKRHS